MMLIVNPSGGQSKMRSVFILPTYDIDHTDTENSIVQVSSMEKHTQAFHHFLTYLCLPGSDKVTIAYFLNNSLFW